MGCEKTYCVSKAICLGDPRQTVTVGEFVDGIFSSAKKKTRSGWEKPCRVKVPG